MKRKGAPARRFVVAAAAATASGILLALAGCAAPGPGVPGGPVTSGRLSVSVAASPGRSAQQLSAAFELRGGSRSGELVLLSPLGTQLAQARWSPADVSLVTADGRVDYASLDDLAERALGERVPLAALPDWLGGRPWPGAPATLRESGFEQLGWSVDLSRRTEGRLVAQRPQPPVVTLRVVLDAPSP